MGSAVSVSHVTQGMSSVSTITSVKNKPSAKLIPMTVQSTANFQCLSRNDIAPIIIRNCMEEFQHITEFNEPLVRGSLFENTADHWLIKEKYVLMRDVLSSSDTMESLETFKAPNLRRADGPFPVYGTGQPSRNGMEEIVSFLKSQNNKIFIFNVREDATLYIHDENDMVPFSLRDIETLQIPRSREICSVRHTIDNESAIRKHVVDLATCTEEFEFSVYDKPNSESNEPRKYPIVCDDDALTSEEVFRRVQFTNKNVLYSRLAFPQDRAPNEESFDILVERLQEDDSFFADSHSKYPCLIFIDQLGDEKVTTAMVLGCLMLARKHDNLYQSTEEDCSDDQADVSKGEYLAIVELVQRLPNGKMLKNEVDRAIDLCAHRCNIRTDIADCASKLSDISANYNSLSVGARQFFHKKFVFLLERYFFLICFNAYLHEQYSKRFQKKFSTWLENNLHLLRILGNLGHSENSAHPELLSQGLRSLLVDEYKALDILGTSSYLNVSNFRQMPGLPVYGVAQPSRQGLLSMTKELRGDKFGHNKVILVNLRDDISIEGNGFMLRVRETDQLNVPIIIPGICSQKVEDWERLYKRHLLQGAAVQVFVDKEKPATLKTINDPYTFKDIVNSVEDSHHLVYHRFPVRHEAAFDEKDFDAFVTVLRGVEETKEGDASSALVFTCRSGKSRTTTAMAIAGLVCCHRKGFPYGVKPGEQERVSVPNAAFTKGDFAVVKQLVSILPEGHQIKREVDFILDMCSETMTPMHYHVREIIFVTYNRMRNSKNEKQRLNLLDRSIAYLERYIYLILFNAYLHVEKQMNWEKPFSLWLREVGPRTGIYEILNDISFTGDFGSEADANKRRARFRWLP